MAKQTQERIELYVKVPPSGDPIPINVDKFPVQDEVPEEPEIRSRVKNMRNGRSGEAAMIKAKDINGWMRGMLDEEKNGSAGAGGKWRLFVKLIQAIWRTGNIPHQMLWVIIVFIPKGGVTTMGSGFS